MAQDRPLHFVVMVGSLRKGSFNAAIARALPALAPEGVSIEPLPRSANFRSTITMCRMKAFPPSYRHGGGDRKLDGVIFVTPEYNHSVPGVLKNAIDWISRSPNQPFAGKPVALESASPGYSGASGRNFICAMSSSSSTARRLTNRRSSFLWSTRDRPLDRRIDRSGDARLHRRPAQGLRRFRARLTRDCAPTTLEPAPGAVP